MPRPRLLVSLPIHLVLAPLLALACATDAWAQAPTDPQQTIREGLRRQEERSREQQRTLQPSASELTPQPVITPASPPPDETPCFRIGEIALAGSASNHFGWLVDAATPYLRRCVGIKGLAAIALHLDAALRDRGMVTSRVALPPQNLQGGQLLIHVEAGTLAQVRMVDTSDGEADRNWGTWRNAFPISSGELLNVRDLEQGLENMKRLPSQQVTTRLEPGAQAGSSDLVIERKPASWRDRLRGSMAAENSGSQALGRAQAFASMALDNPLGINDIVAVSLNTNLQGLAATHRSQSASVQYSVPWGYTLMTLSASGNRFAQYVQGTSSRFLSSGRSTGVEGRLFHTVWRSASAKLGVFGAVGLRRAASYLDDVELVVQRRRTTSFEAGVSYQHLFAHSLLELDVGIRRGVPWRGAEADFVTASQGGLTLRPKIWLFNAAWSSDLELAGIKGQWRTSLRGQRTGDTTLSTEQIAIGGRGSVRGFDGNSVLMAESGYVVRNDYTVPFRVADGVQTAGVFSVDFGRVWGPSDVFLAGRRLAGLALGLKARRGSTAFELTFGTPLYKPAQFESRRLSVYLSLTHLF